MGRGRARYAIIWSKFFPPDVKMTNVSSTVGSDQIADELGSASRTTPSTGCAWRPTGHVEIAVVVIAGVKDKKISHEHIYWDQASVLAQIGLLDPTGLPVSGAESARKVLDPQLPSRQM